MEVWEGQDAPQFEVVIKDHIFCELKQAVQDLSGPSGYHTQFRVGDKPLSPVTDALPKGWGVQMTVSFQVDETAALNPGINIIKPEPNALPLFSNKSPVTIQQSFTLGLGATLSSQATRIDKYEFYYNVDSLKTSPSPSAPNQREDCEKTKNSSLLSGNLRIAEWLKSAIAMEEVYRSSKQNKNLDPAFKQDVLSYETKFIVITSGSVSPQWKLLRISTNQGSSPLLSGNRTRTHDLLITFGPSAKAGASTTNGAGAGTSQPSLIASNSHLASEIGLAISSGLATRINTP